jgi:septum formation protein
VTTRPTSRPQGLWLGELPLVLASQSRTRRIMLEAAGIPVEARPPGMDERAIERAAGAGDPGAVAVLLARSKALAVAAQCPGRLVIGADQTLALGSRRFTKPADTEAARAQLLALAGHTHELHSAVAAVRDGIVAFSQVDVARLTMRSLSADCLDRYLAAAGAAVGDSVGGYQLESIGIQLFDRVEGDHFTILGLPLLPLLAYLREEGSLLA